MKTKNLFQGAVAAAIAVVLPLCIASCSKADSAAKTGKINQEPLCLNITAEDEGMKEVVAQVKPLLKTANADPMDWKAQLDVVEALRNTSGGFYDTKLAAQCYERVLQYMNGRFFEIPDSTIGEAVVTVITALTAGQQYTPDVLTQCLIYLDELRLLKEGGINIPDIRMNSADGMGSFYAMMQEKPAKALAYLLSMRERAEMTNLPGLENADAFTAFLYNMVVDDYLEKFGDKVPELTVNGHTYTVLAMGHWEIEKPLLRWMTDVDEYEVIAIDENGVITSDLEEGGTIQFNFICNEQGIEPSKDTNFRLVSITPDRRQELLQTYRKYKKNNK